MSGTVPVLHVTEDMAAASGGVPAVVRQLASRWARMGQAVTVLHAKGDAFGLADGIRVALVRHHRRHPGYGMERE